MRGETSFGCSIYQDIETKHIFIIPLSKGLPVGGGSHQQKIYHVSENENITEIGNKLLNAVQDSIEKPTINQGEGLNEKDFEKFGLHEYKKNWDNIDKNCYEVSMYLETNFKEEINTFFGGTMRNKYLKYPELLECDKVYEIHTSVLKKGTHNFEDTPPILLPYPSTPEKIGEAVIDAFKWIDDNFADKKK